MNTDQLESFIQVAENLNFARAAEILNITQSAVSRQIHSLEEELGTKLLHRTTRTVSLSPAGISFLEDAKQVVDKLKSARQRMQRRQSMNMKITTIGCQNEGSLDLLCKILSTCRVQMPDLYPFLKVIPHRFILNLFYQDELDLLFGFRDDILIKNDTVYLELLQMPLCCIVPSAHPYAARSELAKEDLYQGNIVICNSYAIPCSVAEIHSQLSQHVLPESTYVCESLQVLLTLVRAGYGCSVLPQMYFMGPGLREVPLKDSQPLSYGLFFKKSAENPILKKLVSIAADACRDRDEKSSSKMPTSRPAQ